MGYYADFIVLLILPLFLAIIVMLILCLYKKKQKEKKQNVLVHENFLFLSRMIAGITHDLNSKVGVIITALSFLDEYTKETHNSFELNTLTKSAMVEHFKNEKETIAIVNLNLEKIIELIKSFRRLSNDQAQESISTFNLKEYIDTILLSLQPQIRKTSITINNIVPVTIEIESYPGIFSQIFSNIIDNIVVHAFSVEKKGLITIGAKQNQDSVCLEIRDNGVGIPQEIQAKIFDPFFTTNSEKGGTGLGLFVTSTLVKNNLHGSIQCASKVGEGTTFFIHIPTILSKQEVTIQ